MKKYEYKTLQESNTSRFSLDDVNKLGMEGWRVVTWMIADNGYETILFEREINA
jgi:hypothetical protein